VLGLLSLVLWSLTLVVAIKYVVYVLRADNRGEGGILALMALASKSSSSESRTHRIVILLGLAGAALLYGDGMITPAISVLSAVEGLEIAAPSLEPYVQPITIGILIALFAFQSQGSARVGALFGPVTLVWFVVLAALGVFWLVREPSVLRAINPIYAARFLAHAGTKGFLTLGSVFLVATGGEALYADMGHFGAKAIRMTWSAVVFPALLLNYFGQGALLLHDPSAASSPFFRMAPTVLLFPLIALSTCATVIASQALITGAFSLSRQAVMLGVSPRLRVVHTSAETIGQIYVPLINWTLMIATVWLVIGFESSSHLAAAYGIAVSLTMVITTLLAHVVAVRVWKWPVWCCVAVTLALLVPDMAFLAANALKIRDGGWFPLLIGAAGLLLMTTWQTGRGLVAARMAKKVVPLGDFWAHMAREHTLRVSGTAVYLSGFAGGAPPALMHSFQHTRVVHERVILLTVVIEEVPRVADEQRFTVEPLEHGFVRLLARCGFVEEPNVPRLLTLAAIAGYAPETTTYILGRETVIATRQPGMAIWREKLFAFMVRNAMPANALFHLPPDRVVEIGAQIEI